MKIVFSCLLVDFKPVAADLTSSEQAGLTGSTFSGTALTYGEEIRAKK